MNHINLFRFAKAGWCGLLCCIAAFLISCNVSAQLENPDSLFKLAQQFAANKDYSESISVLDALLKEYPENTDYAIYRGRLYSWKGDYPEAIRQLGNAYENNPASYEALEALINAYAWSENGAFTVQYANRGLADFPGKEVFFLTKKAVALENMGKDEEALQAIAEILAKEPANKDALYLQTMVSRKRKNVLSLAYQNTSFSNPGMAPWHLGYLEYKRNFVKAPAVFRVNYGYVYSRSGQLYEADVYPKLNPRSYLYLNAGFSSGADVFPRARAGAEYYQSFNRKFEASLGARFLKFDSVAVTMLTGHFSYHRRGWSFAYRPFLAFIEQKSYLSNGISVKRMNETTEQFVQFDVQYGIVPYTFFFSNEINRTGTFRVGVQYQWRIARHYFVKPFLLYEYEEYVPDQFRNRFNVQLTLSRRF